MNIVTRAALAIGTVAVLASPAAARQYPARSDTGWVYVGKRECCNGSIALAQQMSAQACVDAGGSPSTMRGGVQRRGFCQWESGEDDNGAVVFRCQAEASVPCR